jgi:hypothetical protein
MQPIASLLETMITFVVVMLVLALAAQSIQELIKAGFAVKGATAMSALRGLVRESARARGQNAAAKELFDAVVERLEGLGQKGVRKQKVRLDELTARELGEIIRRVDVNAITGLKGLPGAQAGERLDAIAEQAQSWFSLAMNPVDDRYRRRMRGLALASSAVVVLVLNVNAFSVLQRAREDPTYRAGAVAFGQHLDSVSSRIQLLQRTLADTSALAANERESATADLRALQDTLRDQVATAVSKEAGLVVSDPGGWQWKSYRWWLGILISVLLVSLGAPFWHDTLESLFGLKNRIRAEARQIREETLPTTKRVEVVGETGVGTVKVVQGKADQALTP